MKTNLRHRTKLITLGFIALLSTVSAGPAAAQPLPGPSVAPIADSRPAIASLSLKERKGLQAEINQVLAETKGGKQISANEVSWQNGAVVLVLPLPGQDTAPAYSKATAGSNEAQGAAVEAQDAAVDWKGCPAGRADNRWYCFYEHPYWGGRRLQWNHSHCAENISLHDYNFAYMTSSWVNTTYNVRVETYTDMGNPMWTEEPQYMSADVPGHFNDEATHFSACRT